MFEPDTPSQQPKRHPPAAGCCDEAECSAGLRNNYFVGKRLTPDALRVEQKYLIERRQLLNRAIHGSGVVYGFPVEPVDETFGQVSIGPGLALDRVGRELILVEERKLALDDLIALDDKGTRLQPNWKDDLHRWRAFCWLLSVHYAEKPIGQMPVKDSCGCEREEWNQVCETVRFSLRPVDCKKCCTQPPDCGLVCECQKSCCEFAPVEKAKQEEERKEGGTCPRCKNPVLRGGCRCLCESITSFSPSFECKEPEEIEEPCGSVYVDLHNGVPLACVQLTRDECESWKFGEKIDACAPRPLVKRNDALFDLIRGCDLTRICEIGWKDWHRRIEPPVPFDEFSSGLGPTGSGEAEYITDKFWVKFSRPVRKETLRSDCFAMTIMRVETEGGWWATFRVPIVGVDTSLIPAEPGDPPDHVRSARIVVDGVWVEDAVRGRATEFLGAETQVEVEVRGDFIIDCNGQAVDANAVGLSPEPTGNGTPGCTFISSFRVAAAPPPPPQKRPKGVQP